jgi:hypothetical protein
VALAAAGLEHAIQVQQVGTTIEFIEALELMVSVRADEPVLRRDIGENISFLLRDFHLAVASGDPDTSERLLERLEATALLSRDNVRFLRVERLAKLGRWRELRLLPWFGELARARRPRNITEYLLEALWRSEFDDPVLFTESGAAIRRFEERELGERFRSLIDSIPVPTSPGGRRLAWMSAVLAQNDARRELLLAGVDSPEQTVFSQLAGLAHAEARERIALPPAAQARSLLDDGDFLGAIEVAEANPGDPTLVAIAVRAAFELANMELAVRACALADGVGPTGLPSTPGFARVLQEVRRIAARSCDGWSSWLGRVAGPASWPEAAETARELAEQWNPAEFRDAPTSDLSANHLLSASEGRNAAQLRGSLDVICDLASELVESPAASSLVDAVLLVLAEQQNPSAAVRGAFFGLCADILGAGPSTNRYVDLVNTAVQLWQRVQSRDATSWALDMADLFAATPCPDSAARLGFLSALAVGISSFADRLAFDERSVLQALARECGTEVSLPHPRTDLPGGEAPSIWLRLTNKSVGLYTLLSGVGERFVRRIQELNPAAKVDHNSDLVATQALRTLALSADFLVVDTRHAAHAATGAIDELRPRDRQLFPAGGGISSFIGAVRTALERDLHEE